MVFKVANHGFFELFITLCIICNTAIMASGGCRAESAEFTRLAVALVCHRLVLEWYDPCEQCRHCPAYNPPPAGTLDFTGYTKYGTDLAECSLCPTAKCGSKDITAYSLGKGMRNQHVEAMEISNVVRIALHPKMAPVVATTQYLARGHFYPLGVHTDLHHRGGD